MSDPQTKKIQKSDFIPNHYIITSNKDFILDDDKTLKEFQAQRKKRKIEKKIEEKENQNLNVIWREELLKSKISMVDVNSVVEHLKDFLCKHNRSNLPFSINFITLEFTLPTGKLAEYYKNTKKNFTWDWKEQFEKQFASEELKNDIEIIWKSKKYFTLIKFVKYQV
jgi:hypothetical protein